MRIFLPFFLSICGLLFFWSPALGAQCDFSFTDKVSVDKILDCQENGVNAKQNTKVTGIKEYVKQVAEGVIGFAALFAVGAIVFAGIMYTTAYGSTDRVTKAKNTAIYGAIGLILALMAFPLVGFVVNFLYSFNTGS